MKTLIVLLGLAVVAFPARRFVGPVDYGGFVGPVDSDQEKKADEQKPEEKKADDAKPAEAATEAAKPAADSGITGSIDVGGRFHTDIRGNSDVYRSVVNLGQGPKLFGFDLRYISPTRKFVDKVSLFGTGWGGDPYSTARLDANKERAYDLHVDYKTVAYFNYLPSFANPFLQSGVLMTERGYDTRRRMFDSELRFHPGTRIVPYIAFSSDGGDGRGTTMFVSGGNEYPVTNSLHDGSKRLRGGVNFEFTNFHFTVEQGATWFKDDNGTSVDHREPGDRRTPIAGQSLFLNGETQFYRVRGDGSFTRLLANYSPFSWLDLSGYYLRSNPSINTTYANTAYGNFIDLASLQFYTSQLNSAIASANQPHSSGSFGLELRPVSRLRILESVSVDRLPVTSTLLLTQLTPLQAAALTSGATDTYRSTYNRNQTEAIFEIAPWLSVRGGFRNVWGDATLRAPQVNGRGTELGQLKQDVVLAGAVFRMTQKLRLTLDAEGASAYKSYFRTSLHDYQKGSARLRYQAFSTLSFTASASALYNENPTPGVNYEFRNRAASVGFLWNPANAKRYSFLGDYTISSLKTSIPYFLPTGEPDISRYRDNAHTATMLFDCSAPGKFGPKFAIGGSVFRSSGSRPSTYAQPVARLSMPLHEHANLFTEWRYYGYGEQFYQYEGFRTHIFMVGLRLLR